MDRGIIVTIAILATLPILMFFTSETKFSHLEPAPMHATNEINSSVVENIFANKNAIVFTDLKNYHAVSTKDVGILYRIIETQYELSPEYIIIFNTNYAENIKKIISVLN